MLNPSLRHGMMLNVCNVVSSIYDKYKPKERKSFFYYYFVLKKIIDNARENRIH